MINEIANKLSVILIQNAFPVLEKYINHPHMVDGKPLKVIDTLKDEILNNFKYLIELKKSGRNLFFPNIDRIKGITVPIEYMVTEHVDKFESKNYQYIPPLIMQKNLLSI